MCMEVGDSITTNWNYWTRYAHIIKPFVIPGGEESTEQNIRKNVTKSMKSKMISSFLSIAMWLASTKYYSVEYNRVVDGINL